MSSAKKPLRIKVLPKKQDNKGESKKNPLPWVLLGLVGLSLFALYFINSHTSRPSLSGKLKEAFQQTPSEKRLTQYLQDAQKKSELQSLKVKVENTKALNEDLPTFLPLETEKSDRRALGVELESDPAMDQVYEDLQLDQSTGQWLSPEQRISARLAERKWLYNYEKEEKKTFIRNFIKAAREAGYDIKIDENLIVTRVKVITSRPKIPLDKVIENLELPK